MTARDFEAACFGACVAFGALGAIVACTARETAKDAYTVQSHACLVAYDTRPMQVACLEYVRNKWNKAGAPPAADLDGGSQ